MAACQGRLDDAAAFSACVGKAPPCGKAIVFARRSLTISLETSAAWLERAGETLADIPRPGSRIGPGEPIVTVFATGRNVEDTSNALRREAEALQASL